MIEAPAKLYHRRAIPCFKKIITSIEADLLEPRNLLDVAARVKAEEKLIDVEIVVHRLARKARIPIHRVQPVLEGVNCSLAPWRERQSFCHRHIVKPCCRVTDLFQPKPLLPTNSWWRMNLD